MMAAAATMSPAEVKMVVHIHIVGGQAMWAALTLMLASTPVCPRAAVRRSAAGRFLEGH